MDCPQKSPMRTSGLQQQNVTQPPCQLVESHVIRAQKVISVYENGVIGITPRSSCATDKRENNSPVCCAEQANVT